MEKIKLKSQTANHSLMARRRGCHVRQVLKINEVELISGCTEQHFIVCSKEARSRPSKWAAIAGSI